MGQKSFARALLELLALALAVALVCAVVLSIYTISVLNWARSRGLYATPQQGVIARAYLYYCGVEKVDIAQAATNSFDGSKPHVWYVIYRVYAKNHAPCDTENPGPALYHATYENGGGILAECETGLGVYARGLIPRSDRVLDEGAQPGGTGGSLPRST